MTKLRCRTIMFFVMKRKTIIFSAVLTTTLVAAVLMQSVPGIQKFYLIHGDACEHVGNHYTRRAATSTEIGCREYWVCCNCHQHYLTNPGGTFTNAGVATATDLDSSDTRYISKAYRFDYTNNVYKMDGVNVPGAVRYCLGADTNSVHVYAGTGSAKASFNLNDDTNGHYFAWGDSKNSGKVTYNQHVYANQDNITKTLCAGFSTEYANQNINQFQVYVNGNAVAVNSEVIENDSWANFRDYPLCDVTLKQGSNNIQVVRNVSTSDNNAINMAYLRFDDTSETYINYISELRASGPHSHTFNYTSNLTMTSTYINVWNTARLTDGVIGYMGTQGNGFNIKINASKACVCAFEFGEASANSITYHNDHFALKNGTTNTEYYNGKISTKFTRAKVSASWGIYNKAFVGFLSLNAGTNEIQFYKWSSGSTGININSITVYSTESFNFVAV